MARKKKSTIEPKRKSEAAAGLTDAEEIIEKKPTAPMAITLLMITFVVLIVGTYLNWNTLSNKYFDITVYERQDDAFTWLADFEKSISIPTGDTNSPRFEEARPVGPAPVEGAPPPVGVPEGGGGGTE